MRLIDADEMFKLPNHQEFPTGYTDGYNDAISNEEVIDYIDEVIDVIR